jgi:hypothetical protein
MGLELGVGDSVSLVGSDSCGFGGFLLLLLLLLTMRVRVVWAMGVRCVFCPMEERGDGICVCGERAWYRLERISMNSKCIYTTEFFLNLVSVVKRERVTDLPRLAVDA